MEAGLACTLEDVAAAHNLCAETQRGGEFSDETLDIDAEAQPVLDAGRVHIAVADDKTVIWLRASGSPTLSLEGRGVSIDAV